MKKNIVISGIVALLSIIQIAVYSQNYALDFDGVNDKIGISDAAILNPTSALTVEVWINADTWKSSVWAGTVIGKQAGTPDRGYNLTVGEGGKAEFTISVANTWQKVTSPAIMGLNAWYHIAGVYDGNTLKLYINGELQASLNVMGDISPSTGKVLTIAENPTWTGRYFDGKIDEVRIWNVARSQNEIQSAMSTELTGSETGLVGYWKMNDNTGTSVSDATSNAGNGTMLNMDPSTDWVSGYVVTTSDLGVVGVASPSFFGTGFSTSEKISVEVKNFSTNPINSFQLSYMLNGNAAVTETVNTTIPAFGSVIHTFSGTENLSGQLSCTVKAYVTADLDENQFNDTIQQSITQALENVIFDGVQHNFGSAGQTNIKTVYMPDSLTNYSQVLLEVGLRCPAGGCDPWDQAAQIKLLKNNEEWELGRYITPYGKACGSWVFDVTDFKGLLTGKIQLQSYIQVWGASGWLVDAKITLVEGTPEYKYVDVKKLWNSDFLVYGDTAISYDLTDTTLFVHANAQKAKIRLTTTGHGQGNTSNAAEFMNATHNIMVNGEETFTHNVWKTDCASNACSNQSGTWTLSRAGWCPGQDVQPANFDLADHYTAGQPLRLDYVLQPYVNLLDTGYNSGSHTEPYLRIHGYLVTYSNSPLVSVKEVSQQNIDITVYPNPASDRVYVMANAGLSGLTTVGLFDAVGKCYVTRQYDIADKSWHAEIDVRKIPAGFYFLKVATKDHVIVKKIIVQ